MSRARRSRLYATPAQEFGSWSQSASRWDRVASRSSSPARSSTAAGSAWTAFGDEPGVDDRVEGDVVVRVALVEVEVVAAAELGVLEGRGQQAVDDLVEAEPAGEASAGPPHLARVVQPGALRERRDHRPVRVQQRQRPDAGILRVAGRQQAGEVDLLLRRPRCAAARPRRRARTP